jgi:hypothetical protein
MNKQQKKIKKLKAEYAKHLEKLMASQRILGEQQAILELLKTGQKVELTQEQFDRLTRLIPHE